MNPALNGSSAIRRLECSDAIETRDRITFDFYTGLPHIRYIVTEMCPEKDYSTVVETLTIDVNNFSLELKKSKIMNTSQPIESIKEYNDIRYIMAALYGCSSFSKKAA